MVATAMNSMLSLLVSLVLASAVVLGTPFQAPQCIQSEKEVVVANITDVENQLLTSDGRVFVTGSKNIYEIVRNTEEGGYRAEAVAAEESYYLGIVERKGVVYVLREDSSSAADKSKFTMKLCAGALEKGKPLSLADIFTLKNVTLGNGMAVLPSSGGEAHAGDLIVSDSSIATGRIVRVVLNDTNPLQVVNQEDWLTSVRVPDGLLVFDSYAYVSDTFVINKVPILPDTSAGSVEVFHRAEAYFDDMGLFFPAKGTVWIAVVEFLGGKVMFLNPANGRKEYVTAKEFSFPSSVGSGYQGDTHTVMVTEKGILTDPHGPGNLVSAFNLTCTL